MPKISFIPDNKIVTGSTFPRLKLDKDEYARIVVLEDATYVYTHTLRAPEIGTDDRPIMETKEVKGEQVPVFKLGFIGTHQCLGDLNTLREGRGVDPDNCLLCEASVKNSMVDAPRRRFAAHIAKYATKPGTFDITKPFSVQIQVWTFTEGIFNKLTELQKEFGALLQHDLKLGPCESEKYQKYEINIANDAEWLKTEKNKKYLAEAFEENKSEDLEELIARRKDKKFIEQDLKTVRDRWAVANGTSTSKSQDDLATDLNGLLGNGKPKVETKVVEDVPAPAAEKSTEEDAVSHVAADPDEDPAEESPKTAPKSFSFDDLMSNL